MGKRAPLPITIGGQYVAGDAGPTPPGSSLAINNHLTRPSRYPARPPFVYDGVMSVNGLANFDDTTNRAARLLAIDGTQHLYEKATSGEAWGAANATLIAGTRLTDAANYRGFSYLMFDDGSGLPSAAASFDGTNVSTTPFTSRIQSRTVTTFDERLYFAYPRIVVTTYWGALGADKNNRAYKMATSMAPTGCTIGDVSDGATGTFVRVTPTSLAVGAASLMVANADAVAVLPIGTTSFVFTSFFRSVNAAGFDLPLTINTDVGNNVSTSSPYVLGNFIASGGFLYEATTAGTSAAIAPAYGAVVGGTTADGTVVWTNRGSSTVGSSGATIIPKSGDWTRVDVSGTVPYSAVTQFTFSPHVLFYSSATAALPVLCAIDCAFKDGLADGDLRKANYGWQVTTGPFRFPFHNSESVTVNTATVDMNEVVWTEIGDPKNVRASNTYKLREAVGFPQAATTLGGRYLVAKRNAIWQFQDTGDPDIPIRREKFMAGIGVVGPRAHDKYEDDWFFIGESEVYRYSLNDPIPKAICNDGMREVVMAKGADWVESQSTYKRPLLAIDQSRLIVWVYTQKGKLFAYDLRAGLWSTHYVSNRAEIDAMIWNPNTGNMYVSFGGYGLTRMDYTVQANDTIDNTATTYAGEMTVVFHPVETPSGVRMDATFEELRVMYSATGSQSGQTVTASTSFDQGATYAHSASCTPSVVSTAGNYLLLPIPVWQTAPSVTVKVTRLGLLGEASWSLSPRVEALLNVRRGEFPQANPAAGSVT